MMIESIVLGISAVSITIPSCRVLRKMKRRKLLKKIRELQRELGRALREKEDIIYLDVYDYHQMVIRVIIPERRKKSTTNGMLEDLILFCREEIIHVSKLAKNSRCNAS